MHVIALISGGKDSLYSILHCLANGHKVVALANLHPPLHAVSGHASASTSTHGLRDEGDDLNSFMYQTVGHSIIPLYHDALGIPLYRREISGSAVNDRREYAPPPRHDIAEDTSSASLPSGLTPSSEQIIPSRGADAGQMTTDSDHNEVDETESLIPLLRTIMKQHPEANAISTGAILSNYQRTRVESVALRLGLIPLSYLWQYPSLPPYAQSSLLRDMMAVDQDSRIIKVASGGLDESFLGENVSSPRTIGRLERAVARFGGEGAVLGEGGEFETLAVDGPGLLWKKRIQVTFGESIPGEGGSAVLRFNDAKTVEKERSDDTGEDLQKLRIPRLLDDEFSMLLCRAEGSSSGLARGPKIESVSKRVEQTQVVPTKPLYETPLTIPSWQWSQSGSMLSIANMIKPPLSNAVSASTQLKEIIATLNSRMNNILDLRTSSIVLTTIILRTMSDFASINTIYGALFTEPLPPARITIACGDLLPENSNIMVSMLIQNKYQSPSDGSLELIVDDLTMDEAQSISSQNRRNTPTSPPRIGLHVQSRSYWAPANIGPYSQAISHLLSSSSSFPPSLIHIAGQIPLEPASMTIPPALFLQHTILSLQHLFRIGRAMNTTCFLGVVAVLEGCENEEATRRQHVVQHTWKSVHEETWREQRKSQGDDGDEAEDEKFDIWNVRHGTAEKQFDTGALNIRPLLPDWTRVKVDEELGGSEDDNLASSVPIPPVFTVMLRAGSGGLPLGAPIEWVGLGAAHATVRIGVRNLSGTYVLKILDSNFSIAWIPLRNPEEVIGIEVTATRLGGRKDAIWTVYVAGALNENWLTRTCAAVVPCERVWGANGEELLAVAMVRFGG